MLVDFTKLLRCRRDIGHAVLHEARADADDLHGTLPRAPEVLFNLDFVADLDAGKCVGRLAMKRNNPAI